MSQQYTGYTDTELEALRDMLDDPTFATAMITLHYQGMQLLQEAMVHHKRWRPIISRRELIKGDVQQAIALAAEAVGLAVYRLEAYPDEWGISVDSFLVEKLNHGRTKRRWALQRMADRMLTDVQQLDWSLCPIEHPMELVKQMERHLAAAHAAYRAHGPSLPPPHAMKLDPDVDLNADPS